jgi:hypothetical protein
MSREHNLRRYWYPTARHIGIGVTAHSRADADAMAHLVATSLRLTLQGVVPIEDVDIRALDQRHVIPNMAPPNLRGVWFPLGFSEIARTSGPASNPRLERP